MQRLPQDCRLEGPCRPRQGHRSPLPAFRRRAGTAARPPLLKRARSAGVGLLLATQSPGDLDYKCRDNIATWLVGRIREGTALGKLNGLFAEARGDPGAKLAAQEAGQFYLVRPKKIESVQAARSLVATEQVPEERIARLACESRRAGGSQQV